MTITNYLYCEDEIIGEIVDDVSYDYLTDALGSVTHLVDKDQNVVKNTRYKPFGEVMSNAGSARDPFYRWVGSWGYRATTLATATHYVRARSYDQRTGSWTSVDPLWPRERAYEYASNTPLKKLDYSGLRGSCPDDDCMKGGDPCSNTIGKDGTKFEGGNEKGGWMFCCKGKCYACVNPIFYDENSPMYKCLQKHEENHCKRQAGKCSSDGFPDCQPDCPNDECLASTAEILCLSASLDKCAKNPEVCGQIEDRIVGVGNYAKDFCPRAKKHNRNKDIEKICKNYGVSW